MATASRDYPRALCHAQLHGSRDCALLEIGPVELSPERQPDGRLSSEAAREKIQEALEGGAPIFEWLHVKASGEPFLCEVRLVRLPHATRRLIRGSIVDISERKSLTRISHQRVDTWAKGIDEDIRKEDRLN